MKFLRQKVESTADRPSGRAEARVRPPHGPQPVDLLAHVGSGREDRRLLVQPVGVEPLIRREQLLHLRAHALADRLDAPRRIGLRARDEVGDGVEPRRENVGQRPPLGMAHLAQTVDRLTEGIGDRPLARLAAFVVVRTLGDVDDALDGEETVGRGRARMAVGDETAGQRQHLLQHRLVDDEGRLVLLPAKLQAGLDVAAGEGLAGTASDRRLDRLEARRQTQAQVEALAVDRAQFPDAGEPVRSSSRTGQSPSCSGRACRPSPHPLGENAATASPPRRRASCRCRFRYFSTFRLCSARLEEKTCPPVPSATK